MKRSPGGHGRTGRTVWLVMCAAVAMIAAMMTFPGVARAAVPGSYAVYSGKWGTSGTGNGQFDTPHGVAVSKQGYVYVADTYNDRIQKFTTGGAYQTQWGSYGTGNGQFNEPDSVAVDTTGNVYVTDWGNNRVQKFSPDGVFLFKITSWVSGSADNHFNHPTGIAVDAANNVYVSNTDMGSVEKFDSAGTFLTNWNYGGILTAAGIAIHPSGWVFSAASADLASNVDNRVYQCGLDGSGETIWWLSDDSSPWGVGINPSGGIFVTDVTWDRTARDSTTLKVLVMVSVRAGVRPGVVAVTRRRCVPTGMAGSATSVASNAVVSAVTAASGTVSDVTVNRTGSPSRSADP